MAWRTQQEVRRDRDLQARERERVEIRAASAYWDGCGCEGGCDDDRE
jgi:hypothetical protein